MLLRRNNAVKLAQLALAIDVNSPTECTPMVVIGRGPLPVGPDDFQVDINTYLSNKKQPINVERVVINHTYLNGYFAGRRFGR